MGKINSLRDLDQLLETKKHVYNPETGRMNILETTLSFLSDGKSKTLNEIIDYIGVENTSTGAVEAAVNLLRNNGKILQSQTTPILYWAKNPGSLSVSGSEVGVVKPRKYKEKDIVSKPNPDGTIRKEDGMDLAIWKTMSDNKPRSASDISKILVEFGFDGKLVKERVITLMIRKTWFDRKEHAGKDTLYVLKKTCKKPNGDNDQDNVDELLDNKKAEQDVRKFWDALDQQKKEAPVSTILVPTPAERRADLRNNLFGYGAEKANEKFSQQSNEPTELERLRNDPEFLAVRASDSLALAIWKVMQDGKWYTAKDVALLLSATLATNTQMSIMQRFHALGRDGWFTREKLKSSIEYRCKLKNDPIIPKTKTSVLDLAMESYKNFKENQKSNPPAPAVVETEKPAKQEVVTETTPAVTTPPVQEKPTVAQPQAQTTFSTGHLPPMLCPLFEFNIKIKGKEFSLKEIQELKHFIKTNVINNTGSSIVEVKYLIKGIEFTNRELIDLSGLFNKHGI